MTVAELIEVLQKLNQSAEVRARDMDGSFTAISSFDIESGESTVWISPV
jgi:hypothetical protein